MKLQDLTKKLANQSGEVDQVQEASGEKSIDSGLMVNDQIQATLEMIERIEHSLNEDIQS